MQLSLRDTRRKLCISRFASPVRYILRLARIRARPTEILHVHNLAQLFIFYDGV